MKNLFIYIAMLTIMIASQSCEPSLEPSLMEACSTGNVDLVKKLLNEGANVNYRDNSNKFIKNRTPIHIAVNEGHGEVVKLLLDNGADFTARTSPGGMQPLHDAAYEGFKDIAQLLIEKGADVNSRDRYGWTPLHTAVSRKHKDLVRLFIETGADLASKNSDGKTPFQVADNDEIIELLNNYKLLHPANSDESTMKLRQIETTNYSLEIPVEWEVGSREEEEYMRRMLDVSPSNKITSLFVFAQKSDYAVTVYEIALPAGEGDGYIDKLHVQNEEKFRSARGHGLVKNVLENLRTKTRTFDALLIDWESNRGEFPHSRQWILHTEQLTNSIVIVTAFCNNKGYTAMKDAIDSVASSVKINVVLEKHRK